MESSLLDGAFIVEPQGRGKEEHPCCPLGGRKEGRCAEGWGTPGLRACWVYLGSDMECLRRGYPKPVLFLLGKGLTRTLW